MSYAEIMARMKPIHDREEAEVRDLGDRIGYGRVMQLCEQIWSEEKEHGRSSALAVGPCVGFLVPCGCGADGAHCDWCCGTGRITKRVRKAQREAERT